MANLTNAVIRDSQNRVITTTAAKDSRSSTVNLALKEVKKQLNNGQSIVSVWIQDLGKAQ